MAKSNARKKGNGAGSFGTMLSNKAKPKEKATPKSSKPKVPNVPKGIRQSIDDAVLHKANMKKEEAAMRVAETEVLNFVREYQDKEGYAGKFQFSYLVEGLKETVTFVSQNAYMINPDDRDEIVNIIGEKHFDELMRPSFEVKLKPEVFEDEALQEEFMEYIGDRFDDFFTATESIKPRDNMNANLYRCVEKPDLPTFRTFVRQRKPALR